MIITCIVVFLPIFLYFVLGWALGQSEKKSYPPLIAGGAIENVRMISSFDYPWIILRKARTWNKSKVFRMSVPGRHVFIVSELETFRKVLIDPLSSKPFIYEKMFDHLFGGPNMVSLNGKDWHSRRRTCSPAFSSMHINRMNKVVLEKIEVWINDKLIPTIESNESIDIATEMIGVILVSICETAFEYTMTSEEVKDFSRELNIASIEFCLKSWNPVRPIFGLLLAERRRAFVAQRNLMKMMKKIIDSYRMLKSPIEGTLINNIVNSDEYKTDDQRAAELVLFLFAGHDTTAYTIAWALIFLAQNQVEQTKLRESLSQLPQKDMQQSNVLQMVVKETMRLNPVVSGGTSRLAGRDIMTKEKYLIPKGSIVYMPFILLFRDAEIYNDPDKFIPSRWENPTRDMVDALNPFSLGKQNCIAQSLALAEIHNIIARLCSEFKFTIDKEGSSTYFITLKPFGYRLRVKRV